MKAFEYYAPRTLPEAIDLLASRPGEARAVAGGTDLVLKMKAGKLAPKAVVNIKLIPELQRISEAWGSKHPAYYYIGALTTLEQLRGSALVRELYPALAGAASTMASVQIRNLATVGGNLCNAAPSADLAPILIALDASARIVGPAGERRVPLAEFFVGPGATVLAREELLVALEIPPPAGRALYLKHAPRACMDIAVVGIGIAIRMEEGQCTHARLSLGAVAPTPLRARRAEAELLAGSLSHEHIEHVARIAAEESQPIDDVRGSAWYRRRMVAVMTRRGLAALSGN